MGAAMLDLSMLETPSRLAEQQLSQEFLDDGSTATPSFSLPQVQDVSVWSACEARF